MPLGIGMGLLMLGMNFIDNVWMAAPFFILLGGLGGFLVVPMNALLQHRGHNLMGAGRSIAVQNFNEQACILALGGLYALATGLGLSAFGAIFGFAALLAGFMWLIQRWHQSNCTQHAPRGGTFAPYRSPRPLALATMTNTWRPVLALLFNALVFGLSWWPLREMQSLGLHPLWATAFMYGFACVCIAIFYPNSWRSMGKHPALWCLFLGSGLTNFGFNWAVTWGDVVRVVLLFYTMPAWSVLFAWLLLDERPTRWSLLRLALALCGVALVLKTPEMAWPWPSSAMDYLALLRWRQFRLEQCHAEKAVLPARSRSHGGHVWWWHGFDCGSRFGRRALGLGVLAAGLCVVALCLGLGGTAAGFQSEFADGGAL
jgi:drug/metabolite transporter (DMT)-like permease